MILVLHEADFSNNNIGKIEIPLPMDEDAEMFLNTALAADPSFDYAFYKNPVNAFVTGLKETGIFNKLEFLNMFIGTSKATHALSIINPANNKTFFYDGTEHPAEYTKLGYIRPNNAWKTGEEYVPYKVDSFASFLIPKSYFTHISDVSVHYLLGTTKNGNISTGPCMGSVSKSVPIGFGFLWNHLGSGWTEGSDRNIFDYNRSRTINSMMRKDGVTKGYIDGVYSGTLTESDFSDDTTTEDARVIGIDNITGSTLPFTIDGVFKYADTDTLQDASKAPRRCYNQMIAVGYSLTEEQLTLFNSLVRAFNTSIGRY